MTNAQLTDFLLEGGKEGKHNDTLKQYADRLVLRIFEFPSLMVFLNKVNILDDEIELEFVLIPDDAIESVRNLIGPTGTDIKILTYTKNDQKLTGIKIKPSGIREPDEDENVTSDREDGATKGLIGALVKAQESTDAARLLNELFDRKADAQTSVMSNDMRYYASFPVIDNKGNAIYFDLTCKKLRNMPEGLDAYEDIAEDTWYVKFRPAKDPKTGSPYGIQDNRLHFKVLPVVIDLLTEWMKEKQPKFLVFSSKEDSRTDLYNALVKRFTGSLGYQLIETKKAAETWYLIGRDDVF